MLLELWNATLQTVCTFKMISFHKHLLPAMLLVLASASIAGSQEPVKSGAVTDAAKKANTRPAEVVVTKPEPFDGASVEKMAAQCVMLETEAGAIEIEMLPDSAPENARSFLNLAATGALDTTTFSRVVQDFVIQGGNLSTSE